MKWTERLLKRLLAPVTQQAESNYVILKRANDEVYERLSKLEAMLHDRLAALDAGVPYGAVSSYSPEERRDILDVKQLLAARKHHHRVAQLENEVAFLRDILYDRIDTKKLGALEACRTAARPPAGV